ncbi:MAG: hypothetical protein GY697_21560, partial [Desulfobacterales bacterium]|nr:hypothetical protein [Desulfobacterales bacterium]
MKLQNKLSFAILSTGVMVLILLSVTVYKFNYGAILKSQAKHTQSIVYEVSSDIDLLLQEKVNTALTLANTPILKNELETSNLSYANLSDEKRKESIKLLNEKWRSTKDPTDSFILRFTDNKTSRFLKDQQTVLKGEYGEIFLTNKFGALVASTAKLSTFSHGHKYWWLGSYNNGEGAAFFDDRGYDDSVGGYVLGLVVPIRKGTEIIGILKCNLNILGSISNLISGQRDELIGRFKLTRSGGMVVFEEGFDPLSTQVHDSIYRKLKVREIEPFILNESGKKYLVAFSEIKLTTMGKGYGFGGTFESIDHKRGNTGESWYVICYRKMNVVLSPITESILSIILINAAIILFLLFVAQLFGRKIAKPVSVLDKKRTKALEIANAELSQYAHVVSHDLKAPLRAIHNYSDFLREDLEGILDGDQREYLDGLNRAVIQGEELVNDLLTLARIDRSGDAHEAIDMDVLIHELELTLNLPDNVELSLSDDLPMVTTDKTLLSQIFQNLIDNAVKFNDSPVKRIRIDWNDIGEGNLELFVHDNGIGIAPRFFTQIFHVFQRLHTSKEYEGTGIGLAIVKKAA